MPDTVWRPGARDWIAQRPRVEPNMTAKRKTSVFYQWSAVLIDQCQQLPVAAYGNHCRDPQTDRESLNWSLHWISLLSTLRTLWKGVERL